MSDTRFTRLSSEGKLWRYRKYYPALRANEQTSIVLRVGDRPLIIEAVEADSLVGQFIVGGYLNRPFTGGTTKQITDRTNTLVASPPALLTFAIEDPIFDGGELQPNDSDFLGYITDGTNYRAEQPIYIPPNTDAAIAITNKDKGNADDDVLIVLWIREAY